MLNHKTLTFQCITFAETTELGSLSSQLNLDELWSTLSECLVELGETPDTHAVLVLQPAVEAFFLVHASGASGDRRERTTTQTESREAQLAHLHHEIAPLSPLPSVPTDGKEVYLLIPPPPPSFSLHYICTDLYRKVSCSTLTDSSTSHFLQLLLYQLQKKYICYNNKKKEVFLMEIF